MREIKFRYYVQHDGSGEWRTFDYELTDIEFGSDIAKVDNTIRWDNRGRCQFTGWEDQNGREIIEGDIITSDSGELVLFVDYHSSEFVARYPNRTPSVLPLSHICMHVHVIGNIYENPDLLGWKSFASPGPQNAPNSGGST